MTEKVFGGWPGDPGPLDVKQAFSVAREGVRFSAYDFTSQAHVRLRLFVTRPVQLEEPEQVVLHVLDKEGWTSFLGTMRGQFEGELQGESLPQADKPSLDRLRQAQEAAGAYFAFIAPRGIGPTAWDQTEKKQTQHRRRFMLLGQTLDGMRVWDVCRAIETLRSMESVSKLPLVLKSEREAAGIALYASLYAADVERLDLDDLPPTHRDGPILLNVRRFFDLPQAVAMAAERSKVVIHTADESCWQFPRAVAKQLGWGEDRLEIRVPLGNNE